MCHTFVFILYIVNGERERDTFVGQTKSKMNVVDRHPYGSNAQT